MTKNEVMQMALDALNNFDKGNHGMRWQVPIIKTLRTALAQPEPEPVAWISDNAGLFHGKPPESFNPMPLYLAPPQRKEWVGLTDEEIADMHHEIKVKGMGAYKTEDIYRAIEAKLKDKNT